MDGDFPKTLMLAVTLSAQIMNTDSGRVKLLTPSSS